MSLRHSEAWNHKVEMPESGMAATKAPVAEEKTKARSKASHPLLYLDFCGASISKGGGVLARNVRTKRDGSLLTIHRSICILLTLKIDCTVVYTKYAPMI